jgi:hypothetical protein
VNKCLEAFLPLITSSDGRAVRSEGPTGVAVHLGFREYPLHRSSRRIASARYPGASVCIASLADVRGVHRNVREGANFRTPGAVAIASLFGHLVGGNDARPFCAVAEPGEETRILSTTSQCYRDAAASLDRPVSDLVASTVLYGLPNTNTFEVAK